MQKRERKNHYDWLNRVKIMGGKLGSVLSEMSELSDCPNRAECPKRGRVVRICPTVRACPDDFWGFVRPKAEPRPFCPSRASAVRLSNVRMPTPGEMTFTSPTSPKNFQKNGRFKVHQKVHFFVKITSPTSP